MIYAIRAKAYGCQPFKNSPTNKVTGEGMEFLHLESRLYAKVRMCNWTKSGMLRSQSLRSLLFKKEIP